MNHDATRQRRVAHLAELLASRRYLSGIAMSNAEWEEAYRVATEAKPKLKPRKK